MQTKIAKEIIDTGFGFPVRLSNVPLVEVHKRSMGSWGANVQGSYNGNLAEVGVGAGFGW